MKILNPAVPPGLTSFDALSRILSYADPF